MILEIIEDIVPVREKTGMILEILFRYVKLRTFCYFFFMVIILQIFFLFALNHKHTDPKR